MDGTLGKEQLSDYKVGLSLESAVLGMSSSLTCARAGCGTRCESRSQRDLHNREQGACAYIADDEGGPGSRVQVEM